MHSSLLTGSAAEVVRLATSLRLSLATAESLTAGMVCAALGAVPGASAVLQGGAVTYQNEIKVGVLGVDPVGLAATGAVHADVARQMADGARRVFGADLAVSTTGAAGPEPHGGKPVGTVFVALASAAGTTVEEYLFDGDRETVRALACGAALDQVAAVLRAQDPGNKI
ncbi:CinA family protein [Arthrobacter sp. 260]|uniref:CinA family protein n=1 Tax=Arthrobacter sp. 260 TaxID=2735314 RepID=UPI001492BB45|nr:CinA family protein [Arthrobacter sp. 260]NOJ61248.1 CinA family protein [Arthrobacter sp. 260]